MTKLDHVNLTVGDLDKTIQWYRDVFGFEKVEAGIKYDGTRWAIVGINDSMIAMSETDRKPADTEEDTSIHQIYHFGLRIENADKWRALIKELRLKLYYGGEIDYPQSNSWYVHDPSGHEIEVSCTKDGGPMKFPG